MKTLVHFPQRRFDCDVCSAITPRLEDIFQDSNLRYLTNRKQILEVKFDGVMPAWLRPLTTMLDRSQQAISKYCHGIDLWSQRPYQWC